MKVDVKKYCDGCPFFEELRRTEASCNHDFIEFIEVISCKNSFMCKELYERFTGKEG